MSTTKPTKHSTISVSIDLEDPRVPGHIYVSHDNNRMFFGVGDVIRGNVFLLANLAWRRIRLESTLL